MIDRLRRHTPLAPRPDPLALVETVIAQQTQIITLLETAIAGQAKLAGRLDAVEAAGLQLGADIERSLAETDLNHTLLQRVWGSDRRREVHERNPDRQEASSS